MKTSSLGRAFCQESSSWIARMFLAVGLVLAVAAGRAGAVAVTVDNADAGFTVVSGTWNTGTSPTPWGADYRWRATVVTSPTGEVQWRPSLPVSAVYDVYAWYVAGTNRAPNATFVIEHASGNASVSVNQQINGSQWVQLGTYAFQAGTSGCVRLSNVASGSVVIADAVRFVTAAALPINVDMDADGDVDLDDFAFFQACVSGADVQPTNNACVGSDFDGDQDVDQADFGVFQRCLSGPGVEAGPDCIAGPIPPRLAGAVSGSQFVQQVLSLPKATREQMILAEMTAGNVPEFLRKCIPVTATATINSVSHSVTYYVMPDYLAIGSNSDFVRFPMGPLTAQAIGDTFQCMMPTRKMVNDIYTAASVKLAPYPYSPTVYDIQSVEVFNFSNTTIEGQRATAGALLGDLVGGIKKDVVVTAQLAARPGKVAIYGWHQLNGQPIQPLYLGHEITYMDYSHGIRMVRQIVLLDGQPRYIQDLLKDPALCQLVSDEGVINDPRYH